LAKRRTDEALRILNHIAKSNGRTVPSNAILEEPEHAQNIHAKGLTDLFSNCGLCLIVCIQLFSWFVNSCLYYGLTVAAGGLELNVYASEALSGVVEFPGFVLANCLMGRPW